MSKFIFKKIDNTIIDNVNTYVKSWVKENPHGEVTIGCDSQEHSYYVKYAVSIVMHMKDKWGGGHGAHVISTTIMNKNKSVVSDIYSKLWAESTYVLQVAQMLDDCGKKIIIHLDYNSNESEYSHVLYNSGIGFIKGMGYETYGKPFAYAASHCADKIAKS